MSPTTSNIQKYGWTAVPRDPAVLLAGLSADTQASDFDSAAALPDTDLVRRSREFVRKHINEPTFNHSMRVYVYGAALVEHHFPSWKFQEWREAYLLSCLFHDIGTAPTYLSATASKLSFEFKGAIVARDFILQNGGEEDLADAVCEAVIRHQDVLVQGGNITMVGQLIQLATLIDNVAANAGLISPSLIARNIQAYPRLGWSSCFTGVLDTEFGLKPWCHSTTFERPAFRLSEEHLRSVGLAHLAKDAVKGETDESNFVRDVRANVGMNKFD